MSERVQGRCKWFNAGKGYGFIVQTEKGSKDVFVHYSQIQGDTQYKTLREGDMVEFTLVTGEKGLQAHEVVILTPEVKE